MPQATALPFHETFDFRAKRPFVLNGTHLQRGDTVDKARISKARLKRMFEANYIEPVIAGVTPPVAPAAPAVPKVKLKREEVPPLGMAQWDSNFATGLPAKDTREIKLPAAAEAPAGALHTPSMGDTGAAPPAGAPQPPQAAGEAHEGAASDAPGGVPAIAAEFLPHHEGFGRWWVYQNGKRASDNAGPFNSKAEAVAAAAAKNRAQP